MAVVKSLETTIINNILDDIIMIGIASKEYSEKYSTIHTLVF